MEIPKNVRDRMASITDRLAGSVSAVVGRLAGKAEQAGKYIHADPQHFQPALVRLQDEPPSPLGRRVLLVVIGLCGGLLLWAVFGRLDIVAVAEGKLVPSTYLKIVQPSDAGVIKEILVAENQAVKAGQVLIRMDSSLSESDLKSLRAEYYSKRLALRRIDAQLSNSGFGQMDDDPPGLYSQALAQYASNRYAYENLLNQERATLAKAEHDLAAAQEVKSKLLKTLPHYQQQEAAYEQLMSQGFAGKLMYADKQRERIEKEQDLRAQVAVISSAQDTIRQEQRKIAQITADYERQLHTERAEVVVQLERSEQELKKQEHRNAYLELKAPQDGVVKDLATHTVGTVTSPGTILMTLVPKDELLLAEVWVKNDDIGFVYPSQEVKVKVQAFTFQKYGMVTGEVVHVGADATEQNGSEGFASQAATKGTQPFSYKTLISLKQQALKVDGQELRFSPGMQVAAEIHLGTRSVIEYFLSPVSKAFTEAARER